MMSSQPSPDLPEDPVLARSAAEISKTRWAAAVVDSGWVLRWVSDELAALLREQDTGKLGYGRHIYEAYMSETWQATITPESQMDTVIVNTPYVLHDTPGGRETMAEMVGPEWSPLLEYVEPVTPPAVWAAGFDFLYGDLPPLRVNTVNLRLHDPETGRFAGTLLIYGSALPARVLSLVGRGDEGMFERMTRLFNPGRREAAILFADLQASAVLSRRLPSASYFKLIRAMSTAIDDVVVGREGIVGTHAGDGVTAFFLADDLGSPSRAARAAIEAARMIGGAVAAAVEDASDEQVLLSSEDCLVNVGVHWGGTLYMGQLVTGGRLEVTALGDEVNECARIQQSARDGKVFASKALLERLIPDDSQALDIDPDAVLYTTVGELPGATHKAIRDAGGIPVTAI